MKNYAKELRREIEQEKVWSHLQRKSIRGWESIIRDLDANFQQDSQDNEWKTRYFYQTLHNDMLRKQSKNIRAEIRMIRHGASLFQANTDMDKMSTAACKNMVKQLETELKLLTGLSESYDRQLDAEAAEYHRAHEECQSILNDVCFQQSARIREQELLDRDIQTFNKRLRSDHRPEIKYRKPTVLPPIEHTLCARKSSYLLMYEAEKAKKQKKSKQKKVRFSFEPNCPDVPKYSNWDWVCDR